MATHSGVEPPSLQFIGIDVPPTELGRRRRLSGAFATVAPMLAADMAAVLFSLTVAGAAVAPFSIWRAGVNGLFITPLSILCFTLFGLYPGSFLHPAEEWRRAFWATGIIATVSAVACRVDPIPLGASVAVGFYIWLLAAVSTIAVRAAARKVLCRFDWWGLRVIVLGVGKCGDRIVRLLQQRPDLGLRVVAWLDDDETAWGDSVGAPLTVYGGIETAPVFAKYLRADCALIAMPGLHRDELSAIIHRCGHGFPRLFVIMDLDGLSSLGMDTGDISGVLGLEIRQNLFRVGSRALKRALDLSVTLSLGLGLLPLLIAIWLAVKLSSPGPAFYAQRRIGRHGRCFTVWKFRSMVVDADRVLGCYLDRHPALKHEWLLLHKLKSDPRVTWIGGILRKTSLDELPQLWNILKGDMSLVGPRPIVEQEIQKYGGQYDFYCQVRPGVTGLWQVSGRNNTTYDERVAYDRYYVRNWSPWLDIYILVRTIHTVFTGHGAY